MSWWDEDFPSWFGQRRRKLPGFFSGFFEDFDTMFERMFQEMTKNLPKELTTERKMPDGSTMRQWGPFVYGYSMSVGPDGKPVIREFGNVRPSKRTGAFGMPVPRLEPTEAREPLVDVIDEKDNVKVVAELPGVNKSDIQIDSTGDSVTINVDTPNRKYHKVIDLPSDVDPETAKASYNNGVLEVTLAKIKPKTKGRAIKIE
jgi:HSP20 family protein